METLNDISKKLKKNKKSWKKRRNMKRAQRAVDWFKLGGYLILKSSENSYHVIFDRFVSWAENLKVVAWVSLHSQNRGLIKWLIMQCIKQSSTVRVSKKKNKHSPRIVYRRGKQDKQIRGFLHFRRLIKRLKRNVDIR